MLSSNLLIGTVIVIVCVVFHVAALVRLAVLVRVIDNKVNISSKTKNAMFLMAVSVLFILVIHTIEAWAWGVIYIVIGEFSNIEDALYYSVVTSTTLGYGDITLSDRWRLLSSFEAMGGLILFSASTAFLLGLMRNLFEEISEQ